MKAIKAQAIECVGPSQLKAGPVLHHQLPRSLIARIYSLYSRLYDVYPLAMAEWLDGFQRDVNPEGEVLWWERVANCYVDYIRPNDLNPKQRKAAFNFICRIALGASTEDLRADLAHLPVGAVDQILAIMRTNRRPIN